MSASLTVGSRMKQINSEILGESHLSKRTGCSESALDHSGLNRANWTVDMVTGCKTGKDSLGGPFPSTSHRCHHKSKRCLPIQCGSVGGPFPVSPLLFHPNTKGSQIVMDLAQKTVKRQASFCNAITFSNRPIALYEQVRLKITKKQCCWSGALRLGFTSKDPSRINPDNLPKYACPDLVSQSGFWAKALPEEFANEGNIIAFWVDKKGRVFYRINESSPMLFFSGVRTAEPLWALIDVYGLTRGVQLLEYFQGLEEN
ncbi:hypothetical protein CCH79_00009142 [Gambusia affinis]|uniref:NHR domain-containing protein n=1 Tax=Gambusia affinis TaxID=33528 RepID=A0A315W5J7_GAMAF|nr:hypothetical protein CCH79_00009142 [Gambusia affinis]